MTTEDFDLIATVIDEMAVADESYRHTAAQEFAWALERAYPNFNRQRFTDRVSTGTLLPLPHGENA